MAAGAAPAAMPAAAPAAPGGRPIAAPPVAAAATAPSDPLTEAGDVVLVCPSRVGRPVWTGRLRNHADLAGRGPPRRRFARLARRLREWQEAAAIFPQLRNAASAASAAVFNPNAPIDLDLGEKAWHPHEAEPTHFGGMKDWALILLLTVAVVFFVWVFFYVLNR